MGVIPLNILSTSLFCLLAGCIGSVISKDEQQSSRDIISSIQSECDQDFMFQTKTSPKNMNVEGNRSLFNNQKQRTFEYGSEVLEACLEKTKEYMKLETDQVKNRNIQIARIENYIKTMQSKRAKKSIFGTLVNYVRHSSGGNISYISCYEDSNNTMAETMRSLIDRLKQCETNIENDCNTDNKNIPYTSSCKANMNYFSCYVKRCISLPGTDSCDCLNSDHLIEPINMIRECKISTDSKQMKESKNICINTFANCKKIEDTINRCLQNKCKL